MPKFIMKLYLVIGELIGAEEMEEVKAIKALVVDDEESNHLIFETIFKRNSWDFLLLN